MPVPERRNLEIFSRSLRNLCATRASVSLICREIGINRQQFDRYLTGAAMPSAHNLRRIARYFALSEEQLLSGRLDETAGGPGLDAPTSFSAALQPQPGELAALRHYLGFYFYYFLTPSWPGQVQCGLLQLYERDHRVQTRYIGRVQDPDYGRLTRSRFDGHAVLRGDRIFILEHARGPVDGFGQTILYAAHRHQANYLTGMASGIGWHPHRGPFASRVILRRLRVNLTLREALDGCGLFRINGSNLDPIVRNFFSTTETLFMTG